MTVLTQDKVLDEIRYLNRLRAEQADFELVVETYRSFLEGRRIILQNCPSTEMFFRVRPNPSSKPMSLQEIGAPPKWRVKGFQRCNEPGEPMLYLCSNRRGAVSESRAQVGQKIFLSQWMPKEPFPLNILFTAQSSVHNKRVLDGTDHILNTYFDTLFTTRIHEDFSDDYKFTAAYSKVISALCPSTGPHSGFGTGRVGIRYPSVAEAAACYNTVIDPETARRCLSPLHVMELEVLEDKHGKILFEVVDTAHQFEDDEIRWNGSNIQIPVPQHDKSIAKLFVTEERKLAIEVEDKPHSEQQLANLMSD